MTMLEVPRQQTPPMIIRYGPGAMPVHDVVC
jgi:hypothetical protein